MNISSVEIFLKSQNLDIREKGNNPRFVDQKCTPDVLSFIADCIVNLNKNDFNSKDIWNMKMFESYSQIIFGKPSSSSSSTKNEYDKFISQPLDLLSYAGILSKSKVSGKNSFKIKHVSILEYISLKDRNAFHFLNEYLLKFFNDSGFIKYIDMFFTDPTVDNFSTLKEKFERFVIVNSNLGAKGSSSGGLTEVRRMFPKAINPLALTRYSQGSVGGRLSKGIITYCDLNYNRVNFRDLDKAKNTARKERLEIEDTTKDYNKYLVVKAKKWVKDNHPQSEVNDGSYGQTSHAHHIFPQSEFPTISDYIENLIALTSGQHLDKAHPNGNTSKIDITYQFVCLKAKIKTIENALKKGITPYNKGNFLFVLNTGFKWLGSNDEVSSNLSYEEINKVIDIHYKTT